MKIQDLKYVFSILFCVNCFYVFPQKPEIIWGAAIKTPISSIMKEVIGHDENGIYLLEHHFTKDLYTLRRLDNKMRPVMSRALQVKNENKKVEFEFLLHINDRLFLFTSIPDKSRSATVLHYEELHTSNFMRKSDRLEITAIPFGKKGQRDQADFDFEVSAEQSKFLIYHTIPHEKGQREEFGFHVFDNNMEKVWSEKVTLPYQGNLFDISEYEISERGEVYVLGRLYQNKEKERIKGKANYTYNVVKFKTNGGFKQFPIAAEGRFFTDMQIKVNNENELICAGFYSNEGTSSIRGSFFMKIDDTSTKTIKDSFKEFDIGFIAQSMKAQQARKAARKEAKGKAPELYEFDLDDIIIRSDGGAVLVGEQYFERVIRDRGPNGQLSTTIQYHYLDIFAVNINPLGEIEWAQKIPKYQVSHRGHSILSSYALAVVGSNLHFFFNDTPKNVSYKGIGPVKRNLFTGDSIVMMVTLNKEGKKRRSILYAKQDAGARTVPILCKQVSDREMIMFGKRRRSIKYAKLIF